ncbi:hypothetical protein CEUSTIGMA_g3822.t1 [Chlamydomonas eustigma]|uniref:Uncharacterized protein n=1 Tax=Chlamydomonas eustigma TaxID=1157962 RepID=A0A250WZZ6_9CHLO|nr:hypothetical protein CEUSTIGMA_g3822.t1 [Chlamydomonas eustigma]|eukprot:GAX76376.1 hypothetical protein CEUSTIGMA_g3822.t1 [Chlamydomonas eustigma]
MSRHENHVGHEASLIVDDDENIKEGRDNSQPARNIFEAAERGQIGWVVKAVERTLDYDINQRDRLLRTGLHWASESGHVEMVETLLDYGCDIKLAECNGRTAIHLASRAGHLEVLKALLEDRPQDQIEYLVNQTDNYGITPVFLAIQRGDDAKHVFNFLMLCGAKYNSQYKLSNIPEAMMMTAGHDGKKVEGGDEDGDDCFNGNK